MKRVLVLVPNVWDKEALTHPAVRGRYQFVFAGEELLETPSIFEALAFDIFRYADALVALARRERVEAVVGTGDYPGCMLAAMVAEQLGLPTPPARDVVLLSHKFYSRKVQQRSVPAAVPSFVSLDPMRPAVPAFPSFIKPVKGTMSIRAQLVRDPAELRRAMRFSWREVVRAHLLLRPYQQLLSRYSDGRVPAHHFVAEAPLRGEQVTVDGFVQSGRVTIMGVVDSVMYPGTMSFERFQYPSRLSADVQRRMRELVTTFIEASGLDHTCFNVELFHDAATDAISIIELNPRMSYQFGDLYERVDGTHTYAIQLALACGEPAPWRAGAGRDRVAASFVMRRFSDAKVLAVPDAAALNRIAREVPGATVKLLCETGERLSDHDQDVGSYRYCIVNLSAPDEATLHARYARVRELARFEFDALDPGAPESAEAKPDPDLARAG